MEKKTDALVIKSVDYRESDKIVTLLTADYGKIGAAVKGVKKAGAKLRFAAQPFCFAEYVLAQKDDRHTVISASLYDSFFALSEDLRTYYSACAVLEVCDKLSYENMDTRGLLVDAVKALKSISTENCAETLMCFLLKGLSFAGYPVRAEEKCPVCKRPLSGRMGFDFSCGAFVCGSCPGTPASESTYLTLRAALCGGQIPKGDGVIRALRLLRAQLVKHTGVDFPALQEATDILEEEE